MAQLSSNQLRRKFVTERSLDFQSSLHGGARHHAVVVSEEVGKLGARQLERIAETPKQPEQVDVRYRVGSHCPLATSKAVLGDRINGPGVVGALAPGRMHRRRDEGHP